MDRNGETLDLYVGSFTDGGTRGLHHLRMRSESGELIQAGAYESGENPTYLTFDRQGRYLYATSEVKELRGMPTGGASAFAVDPADGALRLLGTVPTGGEEPCHLSIDPSGRWLLAANYGGGSLAAIPITGEGGLGAPADCVRHHGSSADPERQEGPHVHAVISDPEGNHILAADLGTDRIELYRLDAAHGRLLRHDSGLEGRAASGPRHMVFHPDGRMLYVVNELDSTVSLFRYEPQRPALHELGRVSTLDEHFSGRNLAAEIALSPSGRHLYVSNRGEESIAVFAIDAGTAEPVPVGRVNAGGREPHNFTFDPSGRFLLVPTQHSDAVVVFRVDPVTGMPAATGYRAEIPCPTTVRFRPG